MGTLSCRMCVIHISMQDYIYRLKPSSNWSPCIFTLVQSPCSTPPRFLRFRIFFFSTFFVTSAPPRSFSFFLSVLILLGGFCYASLFVSFYSFFFLNYLLIMYFDIKAGSHDCFTVGFMYVIFIFSPSYCHYMIHESK